VILRVPLQAPDASQLTASVVPQIRVADLPFSMLDGETERFTTGTVIGMLSSVTETLSVVVPPPPVQVRM
jgi:hypothetical protein